MSDRGTPPTEQVLALVQSVFAEAALTSCQLFEGQHDNVNMDLNLSAPTMQVVLKIYTSADSRRTSLKETYLLRMLTSEIGVPVPRVLHFDDTMALVAHPWALHTHLPGKPLSSIVSVLDEYELETIGYETGRYLAHIHQIPLSGFGELFAPPSEEGVSERAYVMAAISEVAETCAAKQLMPPTDLQRLRQLARHAERLEQRRPCLQHGDCTPENVIVDRGYTGYHVTGLLEFEQALGASPERDIAMLLNWGMERWPAFVRGFLDGYAESGTVVSSFWPRLRLYQAVLSVEHLVAEGTQTQGSVAECQGRIAEALALWSR